jgi:hypothetical protein
VRQGQEVRITVRATNRTDRPLVVPRCFLLGSELGLDARGELLHEGSRLDRDERGPLMGQWFSNGNITRDYFVRIPARGSVELYSEKVREYFVAGITKERSPEDLALLPTGRYEFRFRFAAERKAVYRRPGEAKARPGTFAGRWAHDFDAEAKKLYEAMWTGAATASARFDIVR